MTEDVIDPRLAALPPKIAKPIADLHTMGHLNNTVLSELLDAAEIAVDASPLIAFAAAYFGMSASGVPIRDTIRMARSLHHPINLRWSAKRWRTEHDRLARRETLAALEHDNTVYDIEPYAARLPDNFPGYLIPSRRRLAWEGLRQAHCIATYHDSIAAGHYAVATVLLWGKRWTALLRHHHDASKPALEIVDIRGRKNATPDPATRQAIHFELNIPMPQHATPRQPDSRHAIPAQNYRRNFANALAVLRAYRVEEVEITFEGSGDSGCIDNIAFNPEPAMAELRADWTAFDSHTTHVITTNNGALFQDQDTVCTDSLDTALQDIAMEYIEETNVNWYDHDGGYGTLRIDVDAGTIDLEIITRILDSHCEHTSVVNIDDWQDAR